MFGITEVQLVNIERSLIEIATQIGIETAGRHVADGGIDKAGQLRFIAHHQSIADHHLVPQQSAQSQTIGVKLTHQVAQLQVITEIGITFAIFQRRVKRLLL